jgi:hypothetical protein
MIMSLKQILPLLSGLIALIIELVLGYLHTQQMFIGYRLIDVNGGFFKGVIKRVVLFTLQFFE